MRDDLIEQLDPKRNYGRMSYEDVVQEIHEGKIQIYEGKDLPVLRRSVDGVAVKGTGVFPVNHTIRALRSEMRRTLMEAALHRWPRITNALLTKAVEGDVQALKLLIETVIGRADIPRDDSEKSLLEKLLQQSLNSYAAEVKERQDVIETTVREVGEGE